MRINWYPGHMAKSKRLLMEQLSRVDTVIELCDARLPYASRNPALAELVAHKKQLLILNKADLADDATTKSWLRYYQKTGLTAVAYDSKAGKTGRIRTLIDAAMAEMNQKAQEKGYKPVNRVMVVGVPNVGKSTFINHLHGGSIAKVGDRPGITRANQWIKMGAYLEVMDTPGLLWPRLDDEVAARRLCYIGTIRDEVVDTQELAIGLLEDMVRVDADRVAQRYKVADTALRGVELLEAVCRGRGFLQKGGVFDTERACAVVLDEFRAGKLGRVSLEAPDVQPVEKRLTIKATESEDGESQP